MFEVRRDQEGVIGYLNGLSGDRFELRTILKKNGLILRMKFPDADIIGAGSESVVFRSPFDPDRLVTRAIARRQRTGILPFAETYYLHRLAEEIWPSFFPHLFAIGGCGYRKTEREYIEGVVADDGENYLISKKKRREVEDELWKLGINLKIDYGDDRNFLIDENNNIWYVDLLGASAECLKSFDVNLLHDFVVDRFGDNNILAREKWRRIDGLLGILNSFVQANRAFRQMKLRRGLGDYLLGENAKRIMALAIRMEKRGCVYDPNFGDLGGWVTVV